MKSFFDIFLAHIEQAINLGKCYVRQIDVINEKQDIRQLSNEENKFFKSFSTHRLNFKLFKATCNIRAASQKNYRRFEFQPDSADMHGFRIDFRRYRL